MGKTAKIDAASALTLALAAPLTLLGCTFDTEAGEFAESEQHLAGDPFSNAAGSARLVTVDGNPIDETGAFFQDLGINGRRCVTCHEPSAGMTITPPQIQAKFFSTSPPGTDPLFRLVDGANGPTAPVATVEQRLQAYSLLLNKGLIRIPFTLPLDRDYDVQVVLNPYPGTGANPPQNTVIPPNETANLSFYRRPLLSANTRFISAVMWDGRENTVNPQPSDLIDSDGNGVQAWESDSPVFQNMLFQSNNATLGHAEAMNVLTPAQRLDMVEFQMNLVHAQETDNVAGPLNAAGATGGPEALRNQETYFGINDSHGGNPFGIAFNPNAMNIYGAWAGLTGSAQNNRRAAIARGEQIFNSRTFNIQGVRGVNDVLGVASLQGTCTTCHTHPNVGNHTDLLPLDLGVSSPGEGDNLLPVFRVTERSTGRSEETTDLGIAILTGRFADLNKQKGPTLRGLASRPPYFHNGSADNLDEVIQFYSRRFHIGFQASEMADLKAFLEAL